MKTLLRLLLPFMMIIPFGCSQPQSTNQEKKASAETTDRIQTDQGDLLVVPIKHATFVMQWNSKTIYVDPVGGAKAFENVPPPDLVLLTDTHPDHLNVGTLKAVTTENTQLVIPSAASKQTAGLNRETTILANHETANLLGMSIEAVPMYNLTQKRSIFHPKGRGNGYLLTMGGKRIYIAGDTEDIPEMRKLKNIDLAFVCMNLPYTMDVKQAADAVLEFKPKIVYPYHYRGQDTQLFKKLVAKDNGIQVRLRNWYP
ncbi:MAG: MBL fold metallo-hydrolase [Proteobacteria bacterium]|nr:MBL fold metallo-hydrolase [Pseudomonadota bacterium]